MRVIAGKCRSLPLKTVPGTDTRPTTDRIKETLFNILNPRISGCRFLDLFSGSGAIGIEALSRGAESAVFVERRKDALQAVRENLEACGFSDRARVVNGDAMSYLKSGEKFDLIFLDPPYASGLLEQALEDIARFDICRRHGIIVAESAADKTLPPLSSPYSIYREYRYGKIKLTVYHRNED